MPTIKNMTPEALAEAYVWWLAPKEALRTPAKILHQILKMGNPSDYESACDIWGEQALKNALVSAPPGALNERSWVFWHRCYHIEIKPVPQRHFT